MQPGRFKKPNRGTRRIFSASRLDPLSRSISPLSVPPPRSTRFGSPPVFSRVHWPEPKLVAQLTYLTWTAISCDTGCIWNLREDKPADQVRREVARS